MKKQLTLLAALLLATPSLHAADSLKTSKLDSLEGPFPKQNVSLGTAKVITTKDPEHAKVLEFNTDYPHPTSQPWIAIQFKPGAVNPKKHSGLRLWLRSDNETGFGIRVESSFVRKDNKLNSFEAGGFKGNGQWQEFVISLNKLPRSNRIDEKTRQIISGGDQPEDADIQGFSKIYFITGLNGRGVDGMGHLMLHKLELIER